MTELLDELRMDRRRVHPPAALATALILLVATSGVAGLGCDRSDSPAEEFGEEVRDELDDAGEEVRDALDDSGDDVGDAIDDAGDRIEDEIDEARDEVDDAT